MKRNKAKSQPMLTPRAAGKTRYLRRASHTNQPEKTFRSVDHLTLHRFIKRLMVRDGIEVSYQCRGKGDKGHALIYAKGFPTKPAAIIPYHETTLREWCEWVWETRKNSPFNLYKTSELVGVFYDDPQKAKASRSRMGRELRRVGFSLVPEGKRSEFWLINEDEQLASLKTVGDVLKEYQEERNPVLVNKLSQRAIQRTLKRRKQELERELRGVNTRLSHVTQQLDHLAQLEEARRKRIAGLLRASKRRS